MAEGFDPRLAALSHAASVEMLAEQGAMPLEHRVLARAMAEATHAIACGLVYVGDQINAQREQVDAEAQALGGGGNGGTGD